MLAEAKGEDTGGTIAALKTELETLQSEHKEVMLEQPLCVDIFPMQPCGIFHGLHSKLVHTYGVYCSRLISMTCTTDTLTQEVNSIRLIAEKKASKALAELNAVSDELIAAQVRTFFPVSLT